MHKYTTDELVAQKPTPEVFQSLKRNPISFILHNIRSAQNVGLFFRLADALLLEKIYLTGYTSFPRQANDTRDERIIIRAENEINKTAIKLVPLVPWEHEDNIEVVLSKLKSSHHQLVGVEQTDQSQDYRKAHYQTPVALLFGHERTGVEDDLLTSCDLLVHIPMLGFGNSHNVATSGTIVASHILNMLD